MRIEWDDAKRDWTRDERGLDFASVARLDWDASFTREEPRDFGEARFITHGPIDGRLCVMVWTYRGPARSVISLRKANARERKRYEQAIRG